MLTAEEFKESAPLAVRPAIAGARRKPTVVRSTQRTQQGRELKAQGLRTSRSG